MKRQACILVDNVTTKEDIIYVDIIMLINNMCVTYVLVYLVQMDICEKNTQTKWINYA